ncbi:hypothetical protein ABPG74_018717 [Tetrahymena malaccensis]
MFIRFHLFFFKKRAEINSMLVFFKYIYCSLVLYKKSGERIGLERYQKSGELLSFGDFQVQAKCQLNDPGSKLMIRSDTSDGNDINALQKTFPANPKCKKFFT